MTRFVGPLAFVLTIASFLILAPAMPDASGPVSRTSFAFGAELTASSAGRSGLVATMTADALGRWKVDGNGGCYWEANDSGPNQCDPND